MVPPWSFIAVPWIDKQFSNVLCHYGPPPDSRSRLVYLTRYRLCYLLWPPCISTSYFRVISQTSLLIAPSPPHPPASVLLNTWGENWNSHLASMALNTCMTLGFPVEVRLGDGQTLPHPSSLTSALTPPISGKQSEAELLKLHRFGPGAEAAKRFWSWLNSAERQTREKFLTMGLLSQSSMEGRSQAACGGSG